LRYFKGNGILAVLGRLEGPRRIKEHVSQHQPAAPWCDEELWAGTRHEQPARTHASGQLDPFQLL